MGTKNHPQMVCGVMWHIEAAVDGVLGAVRHPRGGETHLGPVPFAIALESGSRWPPISP